MKNMFIVSARRTGKTQSMVVNQAVPRHSFITMDPKGDAALCQEHNDVRVICPGYPQRSTQYNPWLHQTTTTHHSEP